MKRLIACGLLCFTLFGCNPSTILLKAQRDAMANAALSAHEQALERTRIDQLAAAARQQDQNELLTAFERTTGQTRSEIATKPIFSVDDMRHFSAETQAAAQRINDSYAQFNRRVAGTSAGVAAVNASIEALETRHAETVNLTATGIGAALGGGGGTLLGGNTMLGAAAGGAAGSLVGSLINTGSK